MSNEIIAIMAPGNMGHAIGGHLVRQGLRVITNLEGRSANTEARAARAGIVDVGSDAALVDEADMVLSVLPPCDAVEFAGRIAAAAARERAQFLFVDCNAVAPGTAAEIAGILAGVGIKCVDAAIRGGAALDGRPQPRIYVSGPGAEEFAALNAYGLDIRAIGTRAGQASGLKMCASAVSKGMVLLTLQAFVSAKVLGVEADLRKELEGGPVLEGVERRAPNLGPDAYRWAGEMDEIAAATAATGLSPKTFEGFAALCRLAEATALGQQTKEDKSARPDFDGIVDILAEAASRP